MASSSFVMTPHACLSVMVCSQQWARAIGERTGEEGGGRSGRVWLRFRCWRRHHFPCEAAPRPLFCRALWRRLMVPQNTHASTRAQQHPSTPVEAPLVQLPRPSHHRAERRMKEGSGTRDGGGWLLAWVVIWSGMHESLHSPI